MARSKLTQQQIIEIFQHHGEQGLSYIQLCEKALGMKNPSKYLSDKHVHPSYISLCQSGKITKRKDGIHVLVGEVQKKPVVPPHQVNAVPPLAPIPVTKQPLNELNATFAGIVFTPVKRGTLAKQLVDLLHKVVFETKSITFEYALVWVGPTENVDSGQWTLVGRIEGDRIYLSDDAPAYKAMPYTFPYVKVFAAEGKGSEQGIIYLAHLTPEKIAYFSSLI